MVKAGDQNTLPSHGSSVLPSISVGSYNVEVEDDDGFIGDKASKGAFWEIFDKWREPLRKISEDPFGDMPTEKITKKDLETVLAEGEPEAAALVQSAVEEFAQQLAKVIRRFRKLKAWSDVECVVMGGGFRGSRIGELAISRCALLLRADEIPIDVEMIGNEPHDAGLIGAAHLLPPWVLDGYDGILAVDIGGTNIRTGVVELQLEKANDLSKARVAHSEIWRHGQEDIGRDAAVEKLTDMLNEKNQARREGEYETRAGRRCRLSRASSPRTARSSAARKIFRVTGKAASSTSRPPSRRPSRRSASMKPLSSCTTTRWCRVLASSLG